MTITWEGIKTALKDAGRVLGYDNKVINSLVKQLPVMEQDDLEDEDKLDELTPEIMEVLETIKTDYKDMYDLAMQLYGRPRSYGVHASGVLIAGESIIKNIPLKVINDKETGESNIVTQFEHTAIEKLGGVKFDILALRTLSVLQYAKTLAKDDIDFAKIDLDDPKVYSLIRTLDTEGIFQIESDMFKRLIKDMKPTSFNDMSALIALN